MSKVYKILISVFVLIATLFLIACFYVYWIDSGEVLTKDFFQAAFMILAISFDGYTVRIIFLLLVAQIILLLSLLLEAFGMSLRLKVYILAPLLFFILYMGYGFLL